MNAELWLVITQQARDTLRPLLDDEEYDGQHLTAVKIFRRIAERTGWERLFKTPTIQGKTWYIYSVIFNEMEQGVQQKARDAIDYLLAEYPNNIAVAGAWWWDGRQIGTQWVDENDHSQGTTGTPLYPVHPRLIDFMPDVWDNSDPDNPVQVPAADLAQVRVMQGQLDRRFT